MAKRVTADEESTDAGTLIDAGASMTVSFGVAVYRYDVVFTGKKYLVEKYCAAGSKVHRYEIIRVDLMPENVTRRVPMGAFSVDNSKPVNVTPAQPKLRAFVENFAAGYCETARVSTRGERIANRKPRGVPVTMRPDDSSDDDAPNDDTGLEARRAKRAAISAEDQAELDRHLAAQAENDTTKADGQLIT